MLFRHIKLRPYLWKIQIRFAYFDIMEYNSWLTILLHHAGPSGIPGQLRSAVHREPAYATLGSMMGHI